MTYTRDQHEKRRLVGELLADLVGQTDEELDDSLAQREQQFFVFVAQLAVLVVGIVEEHRFEAEAFFDIVRNADLHRRVDPSRLEVFF